MTTPGPGTQEHRADDTSCPLRCQCGAIGGYLVNPRGAYRVVCYCHDCQAFAHVLDQAEQALDPQGGSEIFQTLPRNVTFTTGIENLACLRLTAAGLLRWHAGCCGTLIGNTLPTPALSFIGLIRPFLALPAASLDEVFGPVAARVHTASSRGDPRPQDRGAARMLARFVRRGVMARLNGDYRRTPFFHMPTGAPVVSPRVVDQDAHARVMALVRRAR